MRTFHLIVRYVAAFALVCEIAILFFFGFARLQDALIKTDAANDAARPKEVINVR